MSLLHEILAAEKTVAQASKKSHDDTLTKFNKPDQYFAGHTKTLRMLADGAEAEAIAEAAREDKQVVSTVPATLEYFLTMWARTENLLASKNITNTTALADIQFGGETIARNVPVDELLGLEVRLTDLRGLMTHIPTLDNTRRWNQVDGQIAGVYAAPADTTTKTEKTLVPVILSPATDKHPAQIEKTTQDRVIGTFTTQKFSGAATSLQKANILATLDNLIVEVKAARMRANSVTVIDSDLGTVLARQILAAL